MFVSQVFYKSLHKNTYTAALEGFWQLSCTSNRAQTQFPPKIH